MVAVVDKTWADLAALIRADFGKSVPETDVASELIDWFHYRARLMPRRPRQVTISEEVKAQAAVFPAVHRIASDFREGAEMSPWLSDGVRKAKDKHRSDLMFNDWQISHLHLGSHFVAPDKIKRSGELLFAYVDNNEAALLKLVPRHGSWTDRDILRQLLILRPALMEQWEAKGILASREQDYTDEERHNLRKAGMTTMVTIDGRTFMPAIGVSSSGHATRLVVKTGRFLRAIGKLKEAVLTNTTPRDTRSALAFPIGLSVQIRVRLESNGDLTVYDEVRSWGFFTEAAPA